MSKCNKQEIIRLCQEINKKDGEGTIYTLDSKYSNLEIPRWSTGIEDLDSIIGGGMPEGRTVEIFGPESSGKTTLLYHLLARHPLALDVPVEGCVSGDTEFLSQNGWKKISDYKKGDLVLQYNKDGSAQFVKPQKYLKEYCDEMLQLKTKRLNMCLTNGHRVVYYTTSKKPSLQVKPLFEITQNLLNNKGGFSGNIPKSFVLQNKGIKIKDEILRLIVAIVADGNYPGMSFGRKSKLCYVGVKKKRKVERMQKLLGQCSIQYSIQKRKDGVMNFVFQAPVCCKQYPKEWYQLNQKQLQIVADELRYWDSYYNDPKKYADYYSSDKWNADFVQFVYTSLGYATYLRTRNEVGKKIKFKDGHIGTARKIAYIVGISSKSDHASLRTAEVQNIKLKDKHKYCFTVPSSMWVMRREDKIIVTGNTFDSKMAKVHGNRRKQLIVSRAKFGENAYHQVIKFAKAGIPIVGIDSVPSLIPKENADKLMKAVNKDTIEEFRIGAIARLNEKYIPMLEDIIETTGTTVVFINQVRDKMDAMMFGEKTQTPGGRRLKHSCSLRIQVARKGWIEIPNKNPHNSATTEKIGIIMKCKVAKSKVCNPMGECEIPIIFERGVVSFDDIPKYRKELLAERAQKYGKRISKKDLEE